MRKHTKFVAIVVAAVLVLTVGLTTFVLAQEPPAEEGDVCKDPVQTFVGKVASILEVEKEELVDAAKQARREMVDEVVQRCLDRAVENECITEQEGDQILQWWQNRPQALGDLGHRARLHLRDAWCHMRSACPAPCQ